ncbi:hypothetical protein C8R47DRAFT_145155 [Mycena vitilis]|nr:hypothetical protein C8R47DRAFT_145155 [Mycena vitilis]
MLGFFFVAALAVGAFAAPASSSAATCVATDDAGGALQTSSIGTDGLVSCGYQAAGTCQYFTPGGQFSSGSSTCPDSITPAGSSPSTGSSPSSSAAICVATDDAGSALQASSIGADELVSCEYQAAGNCQYFTPGGQFSSGSSTCPDSITPAGSSSSTGSSPSSSLAQCVTNDDAGSALQSSSTTDDGFVACVYLSAGSCEYFSPGGQFSSGSSTCPDGITAGTSSSSGTGTDNSSSPSSPSGSLAQCVTTDDAGSTLQSSSIATDGFVTCNYQTAGNCEYFSPGGQFSSGSSTCPDSITPGSSSSTALTSSVGSFLAESDGNSTSKPASGVQLSQPVVIALLAMNAILVIAVLAAGAIWVFRRHTDNRASSLKGLYSNANAPTSVPLTHGAAEDAYYDKPRGGFDA